MALRVESERDEEPPQEGGSVHSGGLGSGSQASSPSFSSSVPTAQRSIVRREVRAALTGALQHPQDDLHSVQSTATVNDVFDSETRSASMALPDDANGTQPAADDAPGGGRQPPVACSSDNGSAPRRVVSDLSLLSLQSGGAEVAVEVDAPSATGREPVPDEEAGSQQVALVPVAASSHGSIPEGNAASCRGDSSCTDQPVVVQQDVAACGTPKSVGYLSVVAGAPQDRSGTMPTSSFLSGLDVPPMSDSTVFQSSNPGEQQPLADDGDASPQLQEHHHRHVGTPRKSSVSIAVPQATSPVTAGGSQTMPDWSKRSMLSVSPMATHPGPRLPPLDIITEELDEAALRRKIEQLSAELGNRLLHAGQPRSPPRHASESLGTTMMQATSNRLHSHMSATSTVAAADGRKMRDGLIAMSTEARNEDLKTILCKREIALTEALDEQLALQKKLQFLNQSVSGLAAQKTDLEALRHNHHVDMTMLKSDLSAVNKDLNTLRWTEAHVHQEISDLTNSLQRYRHKRSREELKRLQELNTVTYELQTLEKSIHDETKQYQDEWSRLRKELRSIQEEIVTFKPQEWLAAAVAAGMQKKVAAAEFDGDARRAHQYASATLAGAGRRKTVASIEQGRSNLDAFLHGSPTEE